jgi:hypothetical protein
VGRIDSSVLFAGATVLLQVGCAAHTSKPAEHATASQPAAGTQAADAKAADAKAAESTRAASRVREVTWAEYYTAIEERVRQRGGTVIWINPPRTIARAVPPSNAAIAADPRGMPQIR